MTRKSHVAKDSSEKEAYQNFLASKFSLDKTSGDKADPYKSNESSFQEDQKPSKGVKKKSIKVQVQDFLENNWVISLVSSLIVGALFAAISAYIAFSTELGVQHESISNIKEDISDLKDSQSRTETNLNSIQNKLDTFMGVVNTNVNFIKTKLEL